MGETKKRLKALIKMLEGDIKMFGGSGDDYERLESYKEQLANKSN